MSWDQEFHDPIALPDGRKPFTIRNAAQFVLAMPDDQSALAHWETAIECLMLVAEHGGDPMFPHIAMVQALQHVETKTARAPRRKRAKACTILR